jgi:hypothetical protein
VTDVVFQSLLLTASIENFSLTGLFFIFANFLSFSSFPVSTEVETVRLGRVWKSCCQSTDGRYTGKATQERRLSRVTSVAVASIGVPSLPPSARPRRRETVVALCGEDVPENAALHARPRAQPRGCVDGGS